MKKTVWLSYHIGVRGDYEGLYTWLDSMDAKECGDGLALFQYEIENPTANNIAEQLREEIDEAVENANKMRIYIICRDEDTNKIKGKFLFGRRKAAPWAGYAGLPDETDDEG